MINSEGFDPMAPDAGKFRAAEQSSTKGLWAQFDANITKASKAVAATTEEHLMKPWTLRRGGNVEVPAIYGPAADEDMTRLRRASRGNVMGLAERCSLGKRILEASSTLLLRFVVGSPWMT
jgi:hypothetical protein